MAAGRPRTGSIKFNANGTVTVSLQSAPGSIKRVTRTLETEAGERWLADGLAALDVGAPCRMRGRIGWHPLQRKRSRAEFQNLRGIGGQSAT